MEILNAFLLIIFILSLGFYAITALQWFSYKLNRVLFHYTKPMWHLAYFVAPLAVFVFASFCPSPVGHVITLAIIDIALIWALVLWHKKLDKKLVLTPRVKRFFAILGVVAVIFAFLSLKFGHYFLIFGVLISLILAFLISLGVEKLNFLKYKAKAKQKLISNPNLTIIQITASFGKTSIKNFIYQILKDDFKCQKTPRSVNTLGGLVRDINENLSSGTQIYIAEAGARLSGDIAEITEFLSPQIVIVGEIGAQHLEYFKSIENIRAAKLEALISNRLKMAFCHSSTQKENEQNLLIYDKLITQKSADLNGVKFSMKFDEIYDFNAPILGIFNTENIAVGVCVARFLGLEMDKISKQITKLKSVEHRLERVKNDKKFIIDDSFNGNFKGMSESYELVRDYSGRKVIITPGIVESSESENARLAKIINEIFDFVIVTGALNAKIFKENINDEKLLVLSDKSSLVDTLAKYTKEGDLVLFSNDAPSFI